MSEYYREGIGEVFTYDADELEEGLSRHPQLTKEILDGKYFVELRKLPEPGREGMRYHGELWDEHHSVATVWASSSKEMMDLLRQKLLELEPEVDW